MRDGGLNLTSPAPLNYLSNYAIDATGFCNGKYKPYLPKTGTPPSPTISLGCNILSASRLELLSDKSMNQEYEQNGYFMATNIINAAEIKSLIDSFSIFDQEINHYGIRNLMHKVPYIRELALSTPLLSLAKNSLCEGAKSIRAVYFDKLPGANWNVAWHQDTSIAVNTRANIPGFNSWREKQGIMHVEPPEEYLANILTLRIHLDPANTETGVLRVIPGTHRVGRVKSSSILHRVEKSEVIECTANPGDVLLMSPLLFHSSRKATQPKHRRIIHLEYSAMCLPEPLTWYEAA